MSDTHSADIAVTRYYKATRPDGTDFRTGTVDYAAALISGEPVRHPSRMLVRQRKEGTAGDYLSVSVTPTDCTGMSWPCRLFVVEPVGATWTPNATSLPTKRACHTLRVVEELPAHEALGPQGVHVAALIERAKILTLDEAGRLDDAWHAAGCAAWADARDAAWYAAGCAAWHAAGDAAGDAAGALVVRDLISREHYDALTLPWRQVVGPTHPDDEYRIPPVQEDPCNS